MEMIGRAAGRDRADKLGGVTAADLVVDQYAVPAIGSGLGPTIDETHKRGTPFWCRISRKKSQRRDELRVAVRIGTLRADDHDLTRSAIVDGKSLVRANV